MALVLVVDDDGGTRETFGAILRFGGHASIVVSSGEEALSVANGAPFDLVLTDLRLPGMSGIEMIEQLRQRRIDAAVAIMTGFPSTESAMSAGRLGVRQYLTKPINDEDLLALVRACTDGAVCSLTKAMPENGNLHAVEALRMIETRFSESSLSVHSVAKIRGITTEHLCRVVKQHSGDTFHKLLLRVRVLEARRLLETTSLSVKEIAHLVGFRDASHLDHNFLTECGMAPLHYRRSKVRSAKTQ